jgi:hypothetical protein
VTVLDVMGHWVIAGRLADIRMSPQFAWVPPAAFGAVVTGYLAWGAWESAHNPRWLYLSQVWWRAWLRPGDDLTLLVTLAVWFAALMCYWGMRRRETRTVGLTTIVTMVVVGGVLGTASLLPCRGAETKALVSAWVLGLYVGNPPSAYQTSACPGQPPLALQLGQIVCLAATLVGAVAAVSVLWRDPVGRLRSRFVRDAIVLTGLNGMTLPLLQRLAETGRPASIVVIEPDSDHQLLDEARVTGARIMIGQPTSERLLTPVLAGRQGCALSRLYALRDDVAENEAILAAAKRILERHRPDPERLPHLVARIDDPRRADHWRGWRIGSSSLCFEDALSAHESTACALASEVLQTRARQLLLCGDSTLALALLRELSRRTWERQQAADSAVAGRASHPDGGRLIDADAQLLSALPLQSITLLDERAEDLLREYVATSPAPAAGALPEVHAQPAPWQSDLLTTLDGMARAEAAETVVAVADDLSERDMHEAGRVARLHPGTPVVVLASEGAGVSGTIFDSLRLVQRALLVDGDVPEDTWTRVARHWHECYRLGHPAVPGEPRSWTNRPWAELDPFVRQDNILQLRSVMTAVVQQGRRWVPGRSVAQGSFIELTDRDLEAIASAEHARWYQRRLKAGWSPTADGRSGRMARNGHVRVNVRVVPWNDLSVGDRLGAIEQVRAQLARLEDVGFMPIVPEGGPPEAAEFQRVGTVRARRLNSRWWWTRRYGDRLSGDAGDWWVLDGNGDERTVRDKAFRASHERLGHGRWRRVGAYRAWQVSEDLVLRTMEGKATAQPGDWVVEGHHGERWPVPNDQFLRSYRRLIGPKGNGSCARSDASARVAGPE